jgi:hydroxymethylglutaryl-CoA lyase
MAEFVEIFEVGPRDGLQNEARMIPAREKIALVDCLSDAGFRRIEVASFVSPRWVPQMADGAEVLEGIRRAPGVSYAALVPNTIGFDRAMDAGADEIAIFASASEGFSRANLNCTIAESLARFRPVAEAAAAANVRMRGYVSCVVECPYDGPVAPEAVAEVAAALLRDGRLRGVARRHHRAGRARAGRGDARRGARCGGRGAARGSFPRHGRAGARQRRGVAGSRHQGLRRGGGRARRLSLRAGGEGKRGDGGAVHDRLLALGFETGLDRALLGRAAEMARAMRHG